MLSIICNTEWLCNLFLGTPVGGFGGYKWASEPTVLCLISIVLTVVHSVGGMSFQVQIGSVGCYNVRVRSFVPWFLSERPKLPIQPGTLYIQVIYIYIYIFLFLIYMSWVEFGLVVLCCGWRATKCPCFRQSRGWFWGLKVALVEGFQMCWYLIIHPFKVCVPLCVLHLHVVYSL